MTFSAVRYWLVLMCALAAIYGSYVLARHNRADSNAMVGPPVPDAAGKRDAKSLPPLEEFTLTDQSGQPFDSNSLRGKVWVASFFFTNCPAVCWRLNQALSAMQQTNPASQARYVSITCDPDNDTPEALLKYAQHFKADPARWTFLTGDMGLIRRIGQDFFQISVEQGAHTDRACVVDRKGQVRGRFRLTEPDQVEMLERLLAVVEAEPEPIAVQEQPGAAKPVDETANQAKPADHPAPESGSGSPGAD